MSPYVPSVSLTYHDLLEVEQEALLRLRAGTAFMVGGAIRVLGFRQPLNQRVVTRLVAMRLAERHEPAEEVVVPTIQLTPKGHDFARAIASSSHLPRGHREKERA